MLDRLHNSEEFTMSCDRDECEEEIILSESFWMSIDDAKDEGWLTKKIDGEWDHTCPVCQAKGIL